MDDADGTARRDLAASVRRFPRPGEARHRHRLRKPGGLRLGPAHGLRPGRRGQRGRRLQPGGASGRADVRRCDGRWPQDPPRGAVVDGRGRHLQERDLSVSQAVAADRRRRTLSCRLCPSAARRRRRMGEAAGRRAAGDGEDPARLHPAGMAEAAASATRRSTAGSTPAPPPGSPASTAGPSASGGSWRGSSASKRKRSPRRHRSRPGKERAPIHCRTGAPCSPAG